jgi:chemotaxis methyl-accepting protein methylase
MHKTMAGVTILEHELSELRLLVERQTGILLDCPNSALAAHVAEYLESQELDSPAGLLQRFRSADLDPVVAAEFLDGILNVKTGFFRHPGAMNALARHVLPQIYTRKADDGACNLRIWSAGCGTGEEAYSIAMALCDALSNSPSSNGNGAAATKDTKTSEAKSANRNGIVSANTPAPTLSTKEWSIHIVGSDLLASSIATAERGLYPQAALTGLPPAMIRACFSKIGNAIGNANAASSGLSDGSPNGGPTNSASQTVGSQNGGSNGSGSSASSLRGVSVAPNSNNSASALNAASHLLVKPRLRSMVTFNTMNLTKPVYIGRFDCIFCMDVLPHFSRAQRVALLERLHLYLEPGGYLFLSQTEKLCAPNLNFRSETFDGYTFHRKPLAASAAYGR